MHEQPSPLAVARTRAAERQDHPLLTVDEAARKLRVSPMTVRRACDAGELPCIRFGRARRISREYVEGLLQEAAGGAEIEVDTANSAEAVG